jgi:AmmeMemoRadiSam system protein A
VVSAPAHAMEHSLEVQLPFLQRVLGEFSLVPFAVGDATAAQVAEVLERLWGGPETLIVISTDLSHYHEYETAQRIDHDTAERIARLEGGLSHQQACGATPLNGLMSLAQKKGLSIRRLSVCNSGDTAGGRGRVVGYSAFALDEGDTVSREEAGRTLVGMARAAIGAKLIGRDAPKSDMATWLLQPGATFVTLNREGRLRGCIGSLTPQRPLGVDVMSNAEAAAFRDPRFPPLTIEEWADTQTEVSLLSPPRPIRFADEDDLLSKIVPGEDGLILEAGGRRGTFLPQVWESLPDKTQFLNQLKLKAGLPADFRLGRCRIERYRVIKWKQSDFSTQ